MSDQIDAISGRRVKDPWAQVQAMREKYNERRAENVNTASGELKNEDSGTGSTRSTEFAGAAFQDQKVGVSGVTGNKNSSDSDGTDTGSGSQQDRVETVKGFKNFDADANVFSFDNPKLKNIGNALKNKGMLSESTANALKNVHEENPNESFDALKENLGKVTKQQLELLKDI